MILHIYTLIILSGILILKFKFPYLINFNKKSNKEIIFDSVKKIEYKIIDIYKILNEDDEFDHNRYKKYISSLKDEKEINFITNYFDFLRLTSFREQNKPIRDKNNRLTGEFEKCLKYTSMFKREIGYYFDSEFPIIHFYINDSGTGNEMQQKKFISDLANHLRTDVVDFYEKKGRYYASITTEKVPIYNELPNQENVIYSGSKFGLPVVWEYDKFPHMLVTGGTGSGKSVFMNYILTQLFKVGEISVVDFKEVDYTKIQSRFKNYLGGSDKKAILDIIRNFKIEMEEAKLILKENGVNHYRDLPPEKQWKPKFLLLEEVPSLALSLNSWRENEIKEKKYPIKTPAGMIKPSDIAKLPSKFANSEYDFNTNLKEIILQGRAMGYQLIMIMQRADSEFIDTIIRSNCSAKVFLGQKDKMGLNMLEMEVNGLPKSSIGSGYVLMNSKINYINVPFYKSVDNLEGAK